MRFISILLFVVGKTYQNVCRNYIMKRTKLYLFLVDFQNHFLKADKFSIEKWDYVLNIILCIVNYFFNNLYRCK